MHRQMHSRRAGFVVLLIAFALVAAACASDPDAGEATTTTTTTTTLAGVGGMGGSGSPQGSTRPTTTTDAATTTTRIGAAACDIVGVWSLRGQPFLDELSRLSGAPGAFEYVSGDYLVEYNADGTYVVSYVEWRWRSTTSEGSLITEFSGTDSGTWTADEATIVFQETASEVEVAMWIIENDGTLTTFPFGLGETTVQTPGGMTGTVTYTCVGDVLTVAADVDGGPVTSIYDRVG